MQTESGMSSTAAEQGQARQFPVHQALRAAQVENKDNL